MESILRRDIATMSTKTTTSKVLKDGKWTTTKTVTTTGPDGQTKVETFVEENEDGKGDVSDFFTSRIKERGQDRFLEDRKEDNVEKWRKQSESSSEDSEENEITEIFPKSTKTTTSTVFKDGKKITTKTITGPDGKTKVETSVENASEGDVSDITQRFEELGRNRLSGDGKEDIQDKSQMADPSALYDEKSEDSEFTTFQEDSLKSHNDYRARHLVPPLRLSNKMCSYAQEWAEKLIADNKFRHRDDKKYGENIYSSWSSDTGHKIGGDMAVDSWYKEIDQHVFGGEPRNMSSGHFTQVVWAESKKLGVGVASSQGRVIVVANYSPPGNFIGRYAENVPPPL